MVSGTTAGMGTTLAEPCREGVTKVTPPNHHLAATPGEALRPGWCCSALEGTGCARQAAKECGTGRAELL